MKKLISFLALILLFLAPKSGKAQFKMYSWTDTTSVSTSVTTVTTTIPYQSLTVVSDSLSFFIKWNDAQTYFLVPAGGSITFGPADKITVLYIKTKSGNDMIYTAGLKTSKQNSIGF